MVQAVRPRYDTATSFDQRGIFLSGLSCEGGPNLASVREGNLWAASAGKVIVEKEAGSGWESGAAALAERFAVAGVRVVHAVDGAFSTVLYDSRSAGCLAFNDFVGQVPFFYLTGGDCVYFSSQLAPFLLQERLPVTISRTGLELFLSFGCVPGTETIIAGVKKLLPGTIASISGDGVSSEKYWRIGGARTNYARKVDSFVDEIARSLDSSVGSMVATSKRGLGVLLGGLDSSIVASLMRRNTEERILALTASFEDPRYNERAVDAVAAMLGLELREVRVTAEEMPRAFTDIAEAFDEPVSDMIVSPVAFALARKSPSEAMTLFDGTGADDLFQGIPRAARGRRLDAVLNRVPLALQNIIRVGARGALRISDESYTESPLSPLLSSPVERELSSWRNMREEEVEPLLHSRSGSVRSTTAVLAREIDHETLGMARDPENIWAKTAVSMYFGPTHGFDCSRNRAVSYEYGVAVVSPFYDRKLYDLGLSVPWYLKTPQGGLSKPLLRLVAVKKGLLPPEVAKLKKMGLGSSRQSLTDAQTRAWASNELSGWAKETMRDGLAFIDHLVAPSRAGRYLENKRLDQAFQLIQFALWYKFYFGSRRIGLSSA